MQTGEADSQVIGTEICDAQICKDFATLSQ